VSAIHILLVEDNRADVLLVREALDEHGLEYELHLVADGAEAVQFIRQMGAGGARPCPDLMLLDMNLPKADGPEVLSVFRRHPDCGRTPVIVISSSDLPRDRELMGSFGVHHYFKKSNDFDEFMQLGAVVRQAMESKP
jgi:chemotaxis family two-component system response regulator Rcp1